MLLDGGKIRDCKKLSGKQLFADLGAIIVVFGAFAIAAIIAKQMSLNITYYENFSISLSFTQLPYYMLMTTFRIFAAIFLSLIVTLIIGTLAAKSRRAENVIIPILDILQSIPVLGYISFTVTFFIGLAPNKALGVEMAVIFAIFTAQVWNMIFSLYQSLKTIPKDIMEVAENLNLSSWEKFWRVEFPFAIPSLMWNIVMSISGSWFFIVASEAISIGDIRYTLPGVGAYLAHVIEAKAMLPVLYTIIAMIIIITIYNFLILKPLTIWSEKFRYANEKLNTSSSSAVLMLLVHSNLFIALGNLVNKSVKKIIRLKIFQKEITTQNTNKDNKPVVVDIATDLIWYGLLALVLLLSSLSIYNFLLEYIPFEEVKHVFLLGFFTLLRILVIISIALILYVPIGVYIGLNPILTARIQPFFQFFAAFPANLLFPAFAILIIHYNLNANIFTSPLLLLGAQWYVLFNIIAGTAAFPAEMKEASYLFNIKGTKWWFKVIIPGIFPYMVTGMLTATGAAWNASIVAEAVTWGNNQIHAAGIGSYITEMTTRGDFHRTALGIMVMAIYVVLINKFVWRPLYRYAETKTCSG